VASPVFKTGLAGIAFAGRFDSFPPPPQYPSSAFCSVQFQTLEWPPVMRWTKRFLKRLALSEPQAPNPVERAASRTDSVSVTGWSRCALSTRCRRPLVRNPHQVRACRARARNAPRERLRRFLPRAFNSRETPCHG
jgi:hypothetical protein